MMHVRQPLTAFGVQGPKLLDTLDATPPPMDLTPRLFEGAPVPATYKQPSNHDRTFWGEHPEWHP